VKGPVCSICQKEISDWVGNIMIDLDAHLNEHRVKGLCVMCKRCTLILDHEDAGPDQPGIGKELYHFLWDLRSIRNHYQRWYNESFIETYRRDRWDEDCLDELVRVVRLLDPGFAAREE
jgi:hypothetical protein